jgi:hypothetical protein
MRRITTFNRVSADDYFSALDGDLNWAVPDDELDAAVVGQRHAALRPPEVTRGSGCQYFVSTRKVM